jgi:hypothetical protein
MTDNPRKDKILYSLWLTKLEEAELIDKLNNMTMAYLVGDGLASYMRLIDILKGVYERGDLKK